MPLQLCMSRRQGDDTHFWVRARELDGVVSSASLKVALRECRNEESEPRI